jgi:hypothetical protein
MIGKGAALRLYSKSPNPTPEASWWEVRSFLQQLMRTKALESHQRKLVDGSDPLYNNSGIRKLLNPTNGRSLKKNIGHRFTRMRQIKQKDKSRASKLFIPLIRLIRVHLWLTSSYFSQLRKLVDGSDPFYSELDTPHKNILFCVHEPHTLQKTHVGLSTFLLPLFSHQSQASVFSFKRVSIEGIHN